MKNWQRNLLAVLGLSTLGGLAWAQSSTSPAMAAAGAPNGWHRHAGGAGGELRHVLHQLNLTADQKTQVQGILAQAKPQLQTLTSTSRSDRLSLAKAAPTDPSYPSLLAAVKADATARIQQGADIRQQIYAVLTPAQQAQIPQIIDTQQAKWETRKAQRKASASPAS